MGYLGEVTQSIGERLLQARRKRRMTREQLAQDSRISEGAIAKLEQGQRKTARIGTIAALASALDLPISDLLGVEPGLKEGRQADVSVLRAAIYDRSTGREPITLPQLRDQTGDLRGIYWQARYGILTELIPAHLAAARAAVRAARGDEARREANSILAESLQITASLVTHLQYEDLAHVALLQAVDAADKAEDPLLIAAQHSATAWVLSRQGLWHQAQELAATAASEIEPVLSRASAEQIAVWGELLHFGMVALAREGREDEAHQLLALIQAAGQIIGNRTPIRYKVPFDATWATHSAVQLAQATGQPREALRAAERMENPETLPPSVHARYLLNVAWASTLEWKSQEALVALKRIETIAPEILGHHGLARAIVEELMPRRRTQRLPGLVGIAEQVGVVT